MAMVGNLRLKFGFYRQRKRIEKLPQDLNAPQLIDFVFSKAGELITPFQDQKEIGEFADVIAELKPKNVLEIGTANGGTLFIMARLTDPAGRVISLDLEGGKFGGGYPEWKAPVYEAFARNGQDFHLLRGNSHEAASLARVKKLLQDEPLDLLFIDGDHTYEGVSKDFEMYSPLVRPGGLVGFHDILPHKNPVYGINKFWNEIKDGYEHQEIINDPDHDGYGIGIIRWR